MTVSKEAPKIDLNFDTGEDTFKLLGDPVNRDSLNFSFDTSAVASSSTPAISPTTTTITTTATNNNNYNTLDLALLESQAIKSNGRRSTFDPVAIAEHQLQLQNEQEQQLKHNNKIQPEEDVRGQNSQPEVEPHTKNQQQQQQDELQQVVSATATSSAVIEESSLPVDGNQTSQQDASTADAAVSDGSPAHTIDAEAAAPEQAKTATTNTITTTSATTGNESANADAVVDNTKTRVSGEIDTTTTTATTATTAAVAGVIEKKLSSEQKVVSNEPARQPAMSAEKPNTAAAKQTPEPETKTCFCF